jgi:hypothetical protein
MEFKSSRGAHTTIGRFIWEISSPEALTDIYTIAQRYEKKIKTEYGEHLNPDQIILCDFDLYTKETKGSYFKLQNKEILYKQS